EEAGGHVSEGRPPWEGRIIRVRGRVGNIRRRRGGRRAGRRDDGSRGDEGAETGPAVHAERVRRGVRGPAGGTRNRSGQALPPPGISPRTSLALWRLAYGWPRYFE